MTDSKRTQYLRRKGSLYTERSSWIDHWREISEYLLPRSGRFLVSDRNIGDKRQNNIYDSTGTKALRTLAAGMMAGMTSPARPWFRLATPDPKLMEYGPVKIWLNDVTGLMRDIFTRSNTYRSLHALYEELGAFGTGASLVLSNFRNVIHQTPLTVGEYAIATDSLSEVCTLYREFDMTVSQIVEEFGLENCSAAVQNLYNSSKNLDAWVTIIHAIEPRRDREYGKRDAKNMPWMSCYFEAGGQDDKLLRESGFRRFPAVVPRWATSGGDKYGNGPGMESLGDIKQLQHEQLRKAQGIDYKTKPPMQAPSSFKGQEANMLPGGVTYVDMAGPNTGLRPSFEANIDLSHLLEDIRDVRERIRGTFYADLFLMLANDQRSGITAREIAERHEEKLLMLGPVLERLHNEMLNPLIDMTFDYMIEAHIVPPPPQEMHGMDLNVQFVSVLAQAQRAVGTQSVDRLLGTVGSMAQLKPEVLDKLDGDQIVDAYAEMLGVDPNLIVADDKVAIIRADRAKKEAAMQQAAMMQQAADTAQRLGSAQTTEGTALGDLMSQFSGYSIPTGA